MKINIFRKGEVVTDLPLNTANYTKTLMGEHSLIFTLSCCKPLDIRIGDYVIYKSNTMTINSEPECTNDGLYNYVLVFEGVRHSLQQWLYRYQESLYFDFSGTASEQLQLYINFLNSFSSGWTFADLSESTEVKNITFDKVDLLSALNLIAETYKIEWQMNGKHLTIGKTLGTDRSLRFSYGKGKGLYSLRRLSVINSKIVTRAYAVGGEKNLPEGYTKRQLTLPGYIDDEAAVSKFGIREGVYVDEEIYPNRTSTITEIGQINEGTWTVTDSTIDFDLREHFIEGIEPKIVFKSGALSGQEFKILAYNHGTKTIRYEANKADNGVLTPRQSYSANVGDEYTLVGIRMPETYVTAALAKLEQKRAEYLESNKVPRVVYELDIDVLHLKRINTEIFEGDRITIIDESLGVNDIIRVTSISYPGHFPDVLERGMQFKAEVGNEVTYTRTEKIEKDIKETKEVTTQITRTSSENARRNAIALQEFKSMVFDPDGNMQEPMIEAIAGVFGTTSQYYDLSGVEMNVNAEGNPNSMIVTSGDLTHRVYKIDGLGYIWNLTGLSVTGLDPLKSYYLSAKCSRTALTGEWVLTEQQMPTDAEVGYWYFNLGVLSSVIEGARSFRPTKLYTVISGGQIETNALTAYMIDVDKLFSKYIEAEDFWLKRGKIGIFDVAEGQIRTENWDSASNDEGIRFTNNGVLSRNANEQLFPASSGLNYAASLIGMVDKPLPSTQDSFGSYARAGIMGINYKDMTVRAQNQLMWTWGQYGGLFSSLKVVGGVEFPARIEEGTGEIQIDRGDFNVIIAGQHTGAQLPTEPNHGQVIIIKNARSIDLTITAGLGHNFIFADNSQSSSAIIPAGRYRWYQFVRHVFTAGYWFEIGAVD